MPLHQLSVSPADVSGAGLGLALNAPAPLPLATYRLDHPDGGALVLGVLGASHVVTVEHANTRFSEQVSCHLGGELPEHTKHPAITSNPAPTSTTSRLSGASRDRLRERCARESGWLGGSFPGDDAALTALAAEPDGAGWRWQTWHLYPAPTGGTIVYTASRWRP